MTLKERLEIVKEYRKWFEETNGKNDFDLLDCPETLMAFLQIRGLLNDRPKGEWIELHEGLSLYYHIWSNCKKQPLELQEYEVLSDFCPHCGADMRKDKIQ